ncbi:protein of unknown function [Pararobbsia alpina]
MPRCRALSARFGRRGPDRRMKLERGTMKNIVAAGIYFSTHKIYFYAFTRVYPDTSYFWRSGSDSDSDTLPSAKRNRCWHR